MSLHYLLPRFACGLALVVASLLGSRAASADTDYAFELQQQAQAARLDADPEWRALLHFSSPTARRSEVDDAAFFLSSEGRTDPRAELSATLHAFFDFAGADDSAPCRFPARYRWLRERLHWDAARLPAPRCEKFESWRSAVRPSGVTLVFPAAFLNNPASAFGHTLIRIDSGNGDEQNLTDYAANFAAETRGENALLYAFKGTFGGYQGFFTVGPYYERVKKYSDLENRDIWEYKLSFAADEVARIVEHLWELRRIAFGYYYFDQNCSYQLLSLFDIARPSLQLQAHAGLWVIPVDTVRAVAEHPGLVASKKFRPSAATVVLHTMQGAEDETVLSAKEIADGAAPADLPAALTQEERALRLDIAYDYLTYRRIKARDEDPALKDRSFALLRERSKTGVRATRDEVPPPAAPETGHRTAKLALGAGVEKDLGFYQLEWRPAYHDLLDPAEGYSEGSGINFLDVVLRQRREDELELQRFTLLDITSITPYNTLVHPWSWQVSLGTHRENWGGDQRPLVGGLQAAFGRAQRLGALAFAYVLVGPELLVQRGYEDGYAVAAGPRTGVLASFGPRLALELSGHWSRAALGDSFNRYAYGAAARYTLTPDLALRLSFDRRADRERPYDEALLAVEWYR